MKPKNSSITIYWTGILCLNVTWCINIQSFCGILYNNTNEETKFKLLVKHCDLFENYCPISRIIVLIEDVQILKALSSRRNILYQGIKSNIRKFVSQLVERRTCIILEFVVHSLKSKAMKSACLTGSLHASHIWQESEFGSKSNKGLLY